VAVLLARTLEHSRFRFLPAGLHRPEGGYKVVSRKVVFVVNPQAANGATGRQRNRGRP
jgi:hypothetical protein